MVWRVDPGPRAKLQRDLLPGLDAVLVGLPRKLGDCESAVLILHRSFGAGAPKRRAGCKDELEVFVCLPVAQQAFGDLLDAAKFEQCRHATPSWGLEDGIARPLKS